VRFLSKNSDGDGEDRRDGIGRDGQELGLCGGVAELADDGGEGEGECVYSVCDGPGPGRAFTKSLPSPWIVL